MIRLRALRTGLLLASLLAASLPVPGPAQSRSGASAPGTAAPPEARDGQHDFDFEMGTWRTRVRRLLHPLSGSNEWAEYEGTTVVRPIWHGRANLAELEVEGPAGRIQALSLRLYDPVSRQWNLHFASPGSGSPSPPAIGEFRDGRGEFFDQEIFEGRAVLVRFVISEITAASCRFEQSFSTDGGRSWEVNWIATDTREKAD